MSRVTIHSILDTDAYKFSMSYAYQKLYPEAEGVFEFTDRDGYVYTPEFVDKLRIELESLSNLTLNYSQFKLASQKLGRYIPLHYWEWLSTFKYKIDKIEVNLNEFGKLSIKVTDKLYKGTLYEVPILALVSQLRAEDSGYTYDPKEMLEGLEMKIKLAEDNNLKFSDFGTRRRFSFDVQNQIVNRLSKCNVCTGTSNVHFALKHDITPIGTVAHEWFMFHASQYGYKNANYMGLEAWISTFDGDLGIALTDTYTSKVFFENFSKKHAKLFDGVRHDSGDPKLYVDMVIKRYLQHGIDPMTKTIIFSNALTMEKFKEISDYCKNKIKVAAGIGTNLTNDTGNPTSNIVMKLTSARMNSKQSWSSTVKISDDLGKHMGSDRELDICYKTLNIK